MGPRTTTTMRAFATTDRLTGLTAAIMMLILSTLSPHTARALRMTSAVKLVVRVVQFIKKVTMTTPIDRAGPAVAICTAPTPTSCREIQRRHFVVTVRRGLRLLRHAALVVVIAMLTFVGLL